MRKAVADRRRQRRTSLRKEQVMLELLIVVVLFITALWIFLRILSEMLKT